MRIHSYHDVWNIERRIRKFGKDKHGHDRVLPWPGGILLRGVVYFLLIEAVVALVTQLPLLGSLPWQLRWGVIPGVLAFIAVRFRPDGRNMHQFLRVWVAYQLRRHRRRTSAGRPVPEAPVLWLHGRQKIRWDISDVELHRADIVGPATAEFVVPVEEQDRWDGRCAEAGAGVAQVINIRAGERLKVKP